MPTISLATVESVRPPSSRTRAPIGLAFGQKRFATLSLITITGGDPSRSLDVNARPCSNRIPAAEKNSADAVASSTRGTVLSSIARPSTRTPTSINPPFHALTAVYPTAVTPGAP